MMGSTYPVTTATLPSSKKALRVGVILCTRTLLNGIAVRWISLAEIGFGTDLDSSTERTVRWTVSLFFAYVATGTSLTSFARKRVLVAIPWHLVELRQRPAVTLKLAHLEKLIMIYLLGSPVVQFEESW